VQQLTFESLVLGMKEILNLFARGAMRIVPNVVLSIVEVLVLLAV
jgi:hypothetical protein